MFLVELNNNIDSNSGMGFPRAADLLVPAVRRDPNLPLVSPVKRPCGCPPKSKDLSTASPPAKRSHGHPPKADSPSSDLSLTASQEPP